MALGVFSAATKVCRSCCIGGRISHGQHVSRRSCQSTWFSIAQGLEGCARGFVGHVLVRSCYVHGFGRLQELDTEHTMTGRQYNSSCASHCKLRILAVLPNLTRAWRVVCDGALFCREGMPRKLSATSGCRYKNENVVSLIPEA